MSTPLLTPQAGRTYEIRTHGCQMNVHDSERLAGLLEGAGYARVDRGRAPDVVDGTHIVAQRMADGYGLLSEIAAPAGIMGH